MLIQKWFKSCRIQIICLKQGFYGQKWEKDYEPTTIKSDDKAMFQVNCADCGCLPKECKISPSAKECPNCSWDKCCCWETIVNR